MALIERLAGYGRQIDSRYNILPIHAPSIKSTGTILTFPLFLAPLGYLLWGCQTDWVTISGFIIDIFGALILAIPDIPKYSEWAYGGRVKQAHLRLMNEEKPGRFAPETRYYEAFTEALREKLLPSDVPEKGYFDIEEMGINYVMIIKDEELNPTGAGPISIGNIERDLIDVYSSEEGKFRRLGVSLLAIGFAIQLFSMVFDNFFFVNLCGF